MNLKSALILSLAISSFNAFGRQIQIAPVKIPKALVVRHTASCPAFGTDTGEYLKRSVYQMPKSPSASRAKTLYILGCEMFAYNSLEKAYLLNEKGEITDVYVAEIDHEQSITATADLMGADYDDSTSSLWTFQKGRGIGDCGATSTHKYSPELEKFVLIEARIKNECDGDVEAQWPVVYSK